MDIHILFGQIFKEIMKIAVLLSGQVRTFEQTYQSLFDHVIRCADVDFFIHTWDTNGKVLHVHHDYDNSTATDLNRINEIYKPKKLQVEKQSDFMNRVDFGRYQNKTPGGMVARNIAAQWYSVKKCAILLDDYIFEQGNSYDLFVRTRFDTLFKTSVCLQENVARYSEPKVVWMPVQNQFGCKPQYMCNDSFAVGPLESIRTYCDMYNSMHKSLNDPEGIQFHPETMLSWHLHKNGIERRTFDFDYTLLR